MRSGSVAAGWGFVVLDSTATGAWRRIEARRRGQSLARLAIHPSRHIGLLLVCALFAVPRVGQAQQAKVPWHAGDAPPPVAGLSLGVSRGRIDSLLGAPDSVIRADSTSEVLLYRARGLALVYSDRDSLAVIYLLTPTAGDLGGLTVGDAEDSVRARWGAPDATQGGVGIYQVGRWAVAVRLDTATHRVVLLGLGLEEQAPPEAAGPYDSTADARHDVAAALEASQRDHKLVLLDFGANWCLDCQVLDRLFADPTVAAYLAAHFRVVHIDVGTFNRNLDVSKSYGSPIEGGVPAAVVLSPTGRVIATTKDGSLESARSATPPQILHVLQRWVAAAPR